MPVKSLEDALVEELKDLLSAEKQMTQSLKKMAKNARNEELRTAFETHLEETENQTRRLEQVFELLDKPARAKKCEAMAGLIEESKDVMEHDADDSTMDAMMIGAAQKAEHYEIASYGTVCTWAEMLGFDEAAELLKESLAEEKATDEKLTKIAEAINEQAMSAESEEEASEDEEEDEDAE